MGAASGEPEGLAATAVPQVVVDEGPESATSRSDAPRPPDPPPMPAPMLHDALTGTRLILPNGGRISFYSHFGGTKRYFECQCPNVRSHGRCTLTRTLPPHFNEKVANRGRLEGYLAAWLLAGDREAFGSKAAHRAYGPTQCERMEARALLAETEAGRKLLSVERALLPDEPEEHPDLFPEPAWKRSKSCRGVRPSKRGRCLVCTRRCWAAVKRRA